MTLDVKCGDFLKGNDHLYARKARRKKIAFIRIDVTNRHSSEARLLLSTSTLTAGGKTYSVESPAVVIRKLSEFTWDFLLYLIVDFHPITASIEAFLFLTGPLYNWRLRRQLALLMDGDFVLSPGESKSALIAFRGVSKDLERLVTLIRVGDHEEKIEYCLSAA